MYLLIAVCLLAAARYQESIAAPWIEDIRNGQQITIVTNGTSLTNSGAWVLQLSSWLKDEAPDPSQVTVVDVGVSAALSDNANPALSGIKTQLPSAKGQNPDVVFN